MSRTIYYIQPEFIQQKSQRGYDVTINGLKIGDIQEIYNNQFVASLDEHYSFNGVGKSLTFAFFSNEEHAKEWLKKRWEDFINKIIDTSY